MGRLRSMGTTNRGAWTAVNGELSAGWMVGFGFMDAILPISTRAAVLPDIRILRMLAAVAPPVVKESVPRNPWRDLHAQCVHAPLRSVAKFSP